MADISYTVKFPLRYDEPEDGGYDTISAEQITELVKFNIKNIILTNPGERIFDSDFGVGIEQYIFEQFESENIQSLKYAITDQVSRYVPYVFLNNVVLYGSQDSSVLVVAIQYTISQVDLKDVLVLYWNQDVYGVETERWRQYNFDDDNPLASQWEYADQMNLPFEDSVRPYLDAIKDFYEAKAIEPDIGITADQYWNILTS